MPQVPRRIVAQVMHLARTRLQGAPGVHYRRWAFVLGLPLVLSFAVVVTAFGIAPHTVTEHIERTLVVDALALSLEATTPATLTRPGFWREERIQRGDTLAQLLSRLHIADQAALDFLSTSPDARTVFQLVPGRSLRAETSADGKLLTLHYLNGERLLTVKHDGVAFTAENKAAELDTRVISVAGEIRSSLFAATDALNIPDAVAMKMVEIFSTDIDFHKDLRRGDRFSVVYEALMDRGESVGAGRLLSAEFTNRGRTHNVVWFETRPGQGSYFALDGRDIRKTFLRSPLEFSRVSSGFTEARYHPIMKTWTAHKGVDFAAPLGTKIKATADGVVEFAGVQGGYGNVVILRHPNRYTTLYAHMSGFARGIQAGAKVQQSEVIGYVGMTGLTTGPHVHFEFRLGGVHRDPMTVAMPSAFPIAAELKQKFQLAAAPFARAMTLLRDATPAAFE